MNIISLMQFILFVYIKKFFSCENLKYEGELIFTLGNCLENEKIICQ